MNLHPRVIPDAVNGLLGYSLASGDLYRSCERMASDFSQRRVPMDAFSACFLEIFFDLVKRFLSGHEGDLRQGYARMLAISQKVKDTFMRPVIFPLNNEKVCHASWLRNEVMTWYLARTEGATGRLLEMDERAFVAEATADDAPFSPGQFRPDLDFVARTMPDLAFVQSCTPIRLLSTS